jgi:hypothetical protein
MDQRLCPRCGAYWACDCKFEEPEPALPIEELTLPPVEGCQHDWVEVVGVELDDVGSAETARVMACRLCGLYAVRVAS